MLCDDAYRIRGCTCHPLLQFQYGTTIVLFLGAPSDCTSGDSTRVGQSPLRLGHRVAGLCPGTSSGDVLGHCSVYTVGNGRNTLRGTSQALICLSGVGNSFSMKECQSCRKTTATDTGSLTCRWLGGSEPLARCVRRVHSAFGQQRASW